MAVGDEIRRKNQWVTKRGEVNLESLTGLRVWQLEDTNMLGPEIGVNPSPWISRKRWREILAEHSPEVKPDEVVFYKEAARVCSYSTAGAFKIAITRANSAIHFHRNGPLWWTTTTSLAVGIEAVREVNQRQLIEGQARGFLNRWTDPT